MHTGSKRLHVLNEDLKLAEKPLIDESEDKLCINLILQREERQEQEEKQERVF